jgi:hypothetical protein
MAHTSATGFGFGQYIELPPTVRLRHADRSSTRDHNDIHFGFVADQINNDLRKETSTVCLKTDLATNATAAIC